MLLYLGVKIPANLRTCGIHYSLFHTLSILYKNTGGSTCDCNWLFTVEDAYSRTLEYMPADIILCHSAHIIETDRYGRGMDHAGAAKPPQPLFSPSCFISSPLSIWCFPSLCASCGHPCLSASECPCPLPVCFIKPVRDEVKSWRQHSRLVSISSFLCTPRASAWSWGSFTLMMSESLLLIL